MKKMLVNKMMKPAQYAEYQLLESILKGEFPPGTALPGERQLALQLGITRPTLRETLQRMAREGWFEIRHGKSTIVNDYMNDGGMGLLSTMAKHGSFLPKKIVENFLNLRCVFIPSLAKMAVNENPEKFQTYLEKSEELDSDAEKFMEYDWELQRLMALMSGNPLFRMILNDFDFMYRTLGIIYFENADAKKTSLLYYKNLLVAVCERNGDKAEKIVLDAMEKALEIWTTLSIDEKERVTANIKG